ncbi:MAG: hypothetical protein ACPGVY_11380 [Mycobacterium sp.]
MPERTQYGKWVLWPAEGGASIERWPVDGRSMLASGEFLDYDPDGVGAPDTELVPEAVDLPHGWNVEKKGRWWVLLNPDGVKIGKGCESRGEALRQLPVGPTGAPVRASSNAGPAQPVTLPATG